MTLTAEDGHRFSAYRAEAAVKPIGALVIVQQVLGVNEHIRAVCDDYVLRDFRVVAPALYDRQQRNVEFGNTPEEMPRVRALCATIDWTKLPLDISVRPRDEANASRSQPPRLVIDDGLADLINCIHHERPIGDHWLVDRDACIKKTSEWPVCRHNANGVDSGRCARARLEPSNLRRGDFSAIAADRGSSFACVDEGAVIARNLLLQFMAALQCNVEKQDRPAAAMWLYDLARLTSVDADLNTWQPPNRHRRKRLIDIACRLHLRGGRQIDPKLQSMRSLAAMRHFAMQNAAACRHPLYITRPENSVGTCVIAMMQGAVEHQGDRFHSTMRMRFEAARRCEPIFREVQEGRLPVIGAGSQNQALCLNLFICAAIDGPFNAIDFSFQRIVSTQAGRAQARRLAFE
jgi:hypothetical protein